MKEGAGRIESSTQRFAVAIDIGGTFVDLVAVETNTGEVKGIKVPLAPGRHVEAVLEAIEQSGVNPKEIVDFRLSTSIAMDVLAQRRGGRTGLITTKGFRDVLEIGRGDRPSVFDFLWDPSPPLVKRRDRFGVRERVDSEGNVIEPLDEQELREAARLFKKRGVNSVAVCFINSYTNPVHELRAKEVLKDELPAAFICCSTELVPEIQEFERMSTATANAYLGPTVSSYFGELRNRLTAWGFSGDIMIAHMGGGMLGIRSAAEIPVHTCLSGPAAGVVGAAYLAKKAGLKNVIALDMGGTATYVGIVLDGQPLVKSGTKLEFKVPVNLPCIDITCIGAGAGCIAWVDDGGILKAGPHSAGAFPGPACYGKGGVDATATDAHLVLGRISGEGRYARAALSRELARDAISSNVAQFYDMSVEEAADGLLRVVNSNIRNAIGLIAVERGYDLKDFALVAYGGAGPLHAAYVARELGMSKVLIPPWPGLMSALGLLHLDIKRTYLKAVLRSVGQLTGELLDSFYHELEQKAFSDIKDEGLGVEEVGVYRFADLRYYQQTNYLTIPVPDKILGENDLFELVGNFRKQHMLEFGYSIPVEFAAIEVVNVRLVAIVQKAKYAVGNLHADNCHGKPCYSRQVYFADKKAFVETDIYERFSLEPGVNIVGPAIVEQYDATTVIPPGITAAVDEHTNLVLDINSRA